MAKKQAPGRVAPNRTPAPVQARPAPSQVPVGPSRSIRRKATGSSKQQIQEMNNPAPIPKTGGAFKVRATQTGYYDHVRRREDDVFLVNPSDFADADLPGGWMERVDSRTPEKITTAPQALKKEHDRILGGKVNDDPLGE